MNPSTTPPSDPSAAPLGLVLAGGGARAAYQVGVLRGIAERNPGVESIMVSFGIPIGE